jgi:hypothetical protein
MSTETTTAKTVADGNHSQVSNRASALWERAGRPEGRDTEFWLQAELEIAHEAEIGKLMNEPILPLPIGLPCSKKPNSRARRAKPRQLAGP